MIYHTLYIAISLHTFKHNFYCKIFKINNKTNSHHRQENAILEHNYWPYSYLETFNFARYFSVIVCIHLLLHNPQQSSEGKLFRLYISTI